MSDDIFNGTNGNDSFNGGSGTDTVTFAGVAAGYRIDTLSDGRIQIVDIDSSDGDTGADTLTGIDKLNFADKTFSLSMTAEPAGEFRVNTYTMDDQGDAAITVLSDGGYVVTWTSNGQDGSENGIYAQRFDAAGNMVGAETRINTHTENTQNLPAVTALKDGGYVITWTSDEQNGFYGDIYAQRFDAAGNAVGSESRINTTTESWQERPDITALADGGYVIAWVSYFGGEVDIYTQRFDAAGDAIGSETRVTAGPDSSQHNVPAITALADGGYVIAWAYAYAGLDGGIFLQRFDAAGNAVGGQTAVERQAIYEYSPDITALDDGGYVVVWNATISLVYDGSIYAQRFDASGDPVGDVKLVVAADSNQGSPAVTALTDGRYVVTWSSAEEEGREEGGIYARCFDADGNAIGDPILVNTYAQDQQWNPAITALADGGYIITWNSVQDGSGGGIYAQRFDAEGNSWGYAKITGTAADDVIKTGSGSQMLLGLAGNDSLAGGAGDDFYVLNDADTVIENTNQGTDTVQASFTYALVANVENLTLTGSADLNGTGNSLNNVITGNSGNNVLNGGAGVDSISGGLGDDFYVLNDADTVVENFNAGVDTVQAGFTYTLGVNLENLTLTGSSVINGTGNALNNILIGNTANNILNGDEGIDQLIGGLGNDVYVLDDADTIIENVGEGADLVQSGISYTLANNLENLTLGGTAAINGTGNSLSNLITGNGANNALDGGTGADTLMGGLGNDTYILHDADTIIENGEGGTDTVQAWFSYTLSSPLENLTLGGTDNINGTGNSFNNIVIGNTGNNILNGGSGVDRLTGGLGNDTYILNDTDVVTEDLGAGTDTVQASFTYTLGANIENLTLTGMKAINGTGNSLNNIITGNMGNNILKGGSGADQLRGGLGNDTYVLTDSDTITESAGQGTDTVQTGLTHTLGSNLENLTLTGTAAINGTGNALNNIITGNAGNNILKGGSGADQLRGGLGNDTYVLTDSDMITENAGQGTDTAQTSISFTLGANLEQLTLTGTAAINGTGNALNNILTGNAANNTLSGGSGIDALNGGLGNDILVGGSGNDSLTGGTGKDGFRFSRSSSGVDTIKDYRVADDRIEFADTQLKNLIGAGPLNTVFFRASTTGNAVDRNDFLLYETDTGKLFYDMDGNGAGAKVLFAIVGISTHPALTASEFFIV